MERERGDEEGERGREGGRGREREGEREGEGGRAYVVLCRQVRQAAVVRRAGDQLSVQGRKGIGGESPYTRERESGRARGRERGEKGRIRESVCRYALESGGSTPASGAVRPGHSLAHLIARVQAQKTPYLVSHTCTVPRVPEESCVLVPTHHEHTCVLVLTYHVGAQWTPYLRHTSSAMTQPAVRRSCAIQPAVGHSRPCQS
jgi:hypothetical protein